MSFCPMAFRRMWVRFWAGVVLALCTGPLAAQQMQEFDLRNTVFQVPASWTITYSSRDQEYDFASPDGRYQLWARWWSPDEPLLGYPDIVAHETRPLAGQEALFVHIESGAERILQLAFPQADAEGEIFLWQVIAPVAQVPLAEHRALFEQLLAGIAVNGVPALAPVAPAPPVASPATPFADPGAMPMVPPPPPTAGQEGQTGWLAPAPTPQTRILPPPGTVPTSPALAARYTDATGAFSLPLPAGWSSFTTEAAGLREVVLLSPGRDALVLAALARADANRSAQQVLEDFTSQIYRNSLQAKSIEDERWPRIAGRPVHAIETVSKIYPINSVALPYARGRVWTYRATDAPDAFFLATVRAPDAPADLAATLNAIAEGFVPGTVGVEAPVPQPQSQLQPQLQSQPQPQSLPAFGESIAPAAKAPISALPDFAQALRPKGLLFDGTSLAGLAPFAFAGADFARDAQIGPEGLRIAFSEGMGWARSGVAATDAPLAAPPAGQMWRLRAVIDADATNSLTLALSPPEKAREDPWEADVLRLHLIDLGEGIGRVDLTLLNGSEETSAKFHWPKGETTLDLLLRPDSTIEVRDGAGVQLAQMSYTALLPPGPLVAQAYLQVPGKNRAASLVLKRFEAVQEPHIPPPAPGAIITGTSPERVLFDGLSLGPFWLPNARREGAHMHAARLSAGALRIDWAEPQKGAHVGIVSPEPVLWLDGLHGMGTAMLTFMIDPAATGDFEISLSGRYTLPGNLGDNDSYLLRFRRQPDGSFSVLSARRAGEKAGVLTEHLAVLPDQITLVLRPGRVSVEAEGVNPAPVSWDGAVEGTGLRAAVHALADMEGKGALALREVRLGQRAEPPRPSPRPAPGVDPLPQRVLFAPPMGPGWRGKSVGAAEFAKLSMAGPKGLVLMRRDPVPDWNRIALIGPEPALSLDYRLDSTPFDLNLSLAPGPDLGMRLFLSGDPENHEKTAKAALTLEVPQRGPDAGALVVQFHTGHFSYDHWRRVLPADWWTEHWDGTVTLRFETEAISVWLDGRPILRARTAVARRGTELWPVITPGGLKETAPGRVILRGLTAGWSAPEGMEAAERWRLLDDGAFDAGAFADMLAADLKRE